MLPLRFLGFCLSIAGLAGCASTPTEPSREARTPSSEQKALSINPDDIVYPEPIKGLMKRVKNCADIPNLDQFKGECIAKDEAALLKRITKASLDFQTVQNKNRDPGTDSQRDFHAKHNACLAGIWTPLRVSPESLAKRVKVGAFAYNEPLKAVIRYSNGSPKRPSASGKMEAPDDFNPEPRGLAIKLVEIPGRSVLVFNKDHETFPSAGHANQDFVMINFPSFFLHNPGNYPEFLNLLAAGKSREVFSILSKREQEVLFASNRSISDSVEERYFSQVPYVLGNEYAKYSVRPCEPGAVDPVSDQEKSDRNYLRKRIAKRIKDKPICLRFSVQLKKPHMSVEDAAEEWLEKDSPFIDVAEIHIPAGQNIDDESRDKFCEHLSFNPWNSLPKNRPAGGIGRARMNVYLGVSRKRRMENQKPIEEPRADNAFFNVLSR